MMPVCPNAYCNAPFNSGEVCEFCGTNLPEGAAERLVGCSRWRLVPARWRWQWWPSYEEVPGIRTVVLPWREICWGWWEWNRDEERIGYLEDGCCGLCLTGPLGVLRGLLRWRGREESK
jgi:hypothetical protein